MDNLQCHSFITTRRFLLNCYDLILLVAGMLSLRFEVRMLVLAIFFLLCIELANSMEQIEHNRRFLHKVQLKLNMF